MNLVTAYVIVWFMGFAANVGFAVKQYYWEDWKVAINVPIFAIVIDQGTYIGRVNTFNGQIIATAMMVARKKMAVAIHDKKVVYTRRIEILCSAHPEKLYWETVDWNHLPSNMLDNALIAGFQRDISSYLYVGKVKQRHRYKIGKVVPLNRDGPGLWIWKGDLPMRVTKFELLKINSTK